MEDMEWEGHSNWSQVQTSVIQAHIPEFKAWIRAHIKYIYLPRAQEIIRKYYFENASISAKGGEYTYLNMGKSALFALYRKERDNG